MAIPFLNTTSFSADITVASTGTFGGNVTISKAAAALEISSTSGGTAAIIIGRIADTKAQIKSGDQLAGDLTFSTGGNRRLMINNAGAAKFAGTLGVSGKEPTFGLTLPQGSGGGSKIAWSDVTPNFAASIYSSNLTDSLTFATKNGSNAETIALEIDTSQNAIFAGSVKIADDTDAGTTAAKAGTMRYRTGTEYVDVTGTELVTNGNFDSATGWTAQSGWAISGGKANGTTTTDSIYQSIAAITASTKYRLIYTISGLTAGSVRVSLRAAVTTTQTTNGTFTEIVTSGTSADTNFYIDAVASFTGSIDNVSLVELTEEDASYADMCMQTGASTYEWVNIVRNTY